MLEGNKVIVVMSVYNSGKTLEKTYDEITKAVVGKVIVIDDHSRDSAVEVVRKIGIEAYVHDINKGYGANQKTC